jgi:peptidoglycan/LPS O-acetylase OafA/YrhL
MSAWDRRENNFDFMRLSLAALVIYSHAFALGMGSEVQEPLMRVTHGQVSGGAFAVDAFFVMSGFLIAASAERSRGVGSFLKKRVMRIYPAFVVSAVLLLVLVLPLSGGRLLYAGLPAQAGDFLLQTLRLREFSYAGVFAGNPFPDVLNGSTWSVQYEFWCYLGVALLLVLRLLERRAWMLGMLIAAWAMSIGFRAEGWILGGKQLGVLLGPPQIWARMLPLYLAGVVFYLYRDRIPLRGWMAAVAAIGLIGAGWFYTGWTVVFPFAGTYLLFWFAFTPLVKLHGFGRFGDFSYGTYLYGFPIEQLLVKVFGHGVAPWILSACALPIALLMAVGSWYGVERRFLGARRQKETLVHAVL